MAQFPNRDEPRAPKPFDYIPFADQKAVEAAKAAPAGHHVYDSQLLTGFLTGEIVVLTPLHVASGGIELTKRVAPAFARTTPLIKAFVRSGGVRVIPGSTLKGAVRSVVEAITPSTVGKVARQTQVPQYVQEPRGVKKDKSPQENPLSPADRMFGVMDYYGQVRLSDARQIGAAVTLIQVPSLFAPRGRGMAPGRKFYQHGRPTTGNTPTESVPVDGRFAFRCDFDNLSASELGVLLIALGQGEPALHLKLGGGKPACYGSVRFEKLALMLRRRIVEDYLDWEGTEENAEPKEFVQRALGDSRIVLTDQLRRLTTLLSYRDDRNCTDGAY